jgi:hypothetical protein
MEHLQYPIGRFNFPTEVSETDLAKWKSTISSFPELLKNTLNGMKESDLDLIYRPKGWTARQVIHHIADSHTHALIRFKWSLTEDKPMIKPYNEDEYAKLSDYALPIDSALLILQGVHTKWKHIIENMNEIDWKKGYNHPQSGQFFSLEKACALCAWHCMHHLGHIEICKNNNL